MSPATTPSTAAHPDKFLAMQDTRLENGAIVRPERILVDMVEVPTCGFRTVTWAAEHPERGWESGVMLVSRDPYADEPYARNAAAEVLWGRGYEGTYRIVVIP